jgi:hypothetical protein
MHHFMSLLSTRPALLFADQIDCATYNFRVKMSYTLRTSE